MAHKIQIKRGNKADLPTLDVGEFGLCQDTNELFIGNSGNQKIFPPTAPTISDVEGLQTALDNKVDNSQVLTNVPVNAKFTDTTYSEISTSEIDAGTSSTLRTITGRRVKYLLDKVQGWINALTKSDIGLGDVENYSIATQSEAESGTANNRYMTPLGTKQAINTHNIYESSHQDIRQQINSLDADVIAHKAENATQDNVHGLRSEKVVIGRNSNADDAGFIAIGDGAEATSNQLSSIAIGKNAKTDSFAGRTVVIGENATAGGRSVAIGHDSQANNNSGIAIGFNAKITATTSDTHAIAIGRDSLISDGCWNIALGKGAESSADYSAAIGNQTITENINDIVLGTNSHHTKIPGNFTVSGTKNFEIPHPKPEKRATHRIRHGAVESPTAGDTLYRWKVQATKDNDIQYIDLPDYFIHLNKDVQIFVTPQGHFGNGYGVLNRDTEQLEIHCQFEGEYNVLVIGTRNDDHQSVQDWNIKGVEREIGESWTGETYVFSVDEIMEVEEIKEVM